jgi:PilZ domain
MQVRKVNLPLNSQELGLPMTRALHVFRERREFGRRASCIRAVVHIPGRPVLHCIIRNYSQGGALLELPEPAPFALLVRLVIEQEGVDVECHVTRRFNETLGVRFVSPVAIDRLKAAAKSAAGLPSLGYSTSGGDLRRRLFTGRS